MTGIVLVLESIWVLGCCATWLDAYRSSKLMKFERKGGGAIRNAFDLVDATKDRIGNDHSTYSNDDLRKALEVFESVSYDVHLDIGESKVKLVAGTGSHALPETTEMGKHSYTVIEDAEPS